MPKKTKLKIKFKINLRSRKVQVALALIIILAIVGVTYSVIRSNNVASYSNYFKKINLDLYDSQTADADVLSEFALMSDNIKKVSSASSESEALSLIDDSARIIDQQKVVLHKYCETSESSINSMKLIPQDFNVIFLTSQEKDNLQQTKNLVDKYSGSGSHYCSNVDGLIEYGKFSLEVLKSSLYVAQGADSYSKLAKYGDDSYVVNYRDQIEAVYGKSAVKLIDGYLKFLKLTYIEYKAISDGDSDTYYANMYAFTSASNAISGLNNSSDAERLEIDRKSANESLDVAKQMYNIIGKASKGYDSGYSATAWTSYILTDAISSYREYNDQKYPDCSDIRCLINILTDKKYLDGVEILQDGITYVSNSDNTGYRMTVPNSVLNKTVDIDVYYGHTTEKSSAI